MISRTIFPRRRGRRPLLVMAIAGLSIAVLTVAGLALAVHDLTFQLDGDVRASTTTSVGGHTQTVDWDTLFDATGAEKALPAGFTASTFARDFETTTKRGQVVFSTHDATTFTTGSKDTLDIDPGWQCSPSNNVLSKNDIMNTYAAAYVDNQGTPDDETDDHEILYFGLERNSNNGDANVAFWFLQSDADCDSSDGTATWDGNHQDGDLLIVSAFTNGGGVSTIDVYRWSDADGDGGAAGFLDTDSVAHGVDCAGTLAGDTVCATTNGSPSPGLNANITTPWLTSNATDGLGHTLRPSEFFEGGLDLTANNLGDRCFNTFVGDTRSSQSLTATIFDYARGELGECTVSMTTDPSQDTRVVGSTDEITDTATVVGSTGGSGTAPTPTGTVTFWLCAPSELTPADTGTCEPDDGTQVGDPVTVAESVPGTATATSEDAASLITGIGRYCFRATFTADPDDPNYADQTALTANPTEECFTVTGASSLSTVQDWLPNDTATLTGDANLNGTLTFQLYTGDNCGATSGSAITGQEYIVNVDDATSGTEFSTNNATSFLEADSGDYSWLVSYDDTTLEDPADSCEKTTITITD